MNENYPRRRPRLEDTRVRDDNGKSRGFFFTGFQTVICAICIVAAIALMQFGGGYYIIAKSYVKDALKNSITNEEVIETFHHIRDKWFPDAAQVFSSGIITSSSSSTKTNTDSGSSSQASSSSASKSKTTSVSSKPESSSLSALTGTAAVVTNTVNCSFTGGKSLPKISSLSVMRSQMPPKTASFAPYIMTIKPHKPVEGRTTSTFGYRINPITKKYDFHSGMDIAAAAGTPIVAAYSGKIEKVGTSVYYGNYVLLNNGNGIKTFYGHCETVTVKQGAAVKAGDTIAKVGSTGMSTGYHLHFEILINNICVNPQWVV